MKLFLYALFISAIIPFAPTGKAHAAEISKDLIYDSMVLESNLDHKDSLLLSLNLSSASFKAFPFSLKGDLRLSPGLRLSPIDSLKVAVYMQMGEYDLAQNIICQYSSDEPACKTNEEERSFSSSFSVGIASTAKVFVP
jgi:hypothetical protein